MLTPGMKFGPYEILGSLGAGGMGEVYRATDARLNREVAIKVLPDEFASDQDRMARFHREAQVLASVTHSNIAAVYGLEEFGPLRALVMELVEGEDLSARVRRGPLPVDEALRIALQIAEALEAAHERGIIHRDLKPANVKVAPDGRIKVLDFGLAKSVEAAPGGDAAHSPTLSLAATQAGLILGTAAYMSPEQASGMPVDKRSDVWAFGVLLFELLSGTRLFEGETVSHTLAGVLRADIDWNRLPAATPIAVRRLLERCLERDRRRRLRDIGEARILLEEQLGRFDVPVAAVMPETASGHAWRRVFPWMAAALVLGIVATAGVMSMGRAAPTSGAPLILDVLLGSEPLYSTIGPAIALSRDGALLAYVADHGDDMRTLHVRPLHQPAARKLAEGTSATVTPYHPFFSPDGQWIGYVTSSELRRVAVSGGNSVLIAPVARSRGATWLPDDTIVFAAGANTGLSRVPAAGGPVVPVTELDASKKEATHRWPQALPGGRAVLFTSHTNVASDFGNAVIEAVTLDTRQRTVIHTGGSHAQYLPSGHIVFANQGTVYAMPFDPDRLQATGTPVPVLHGVGFSGIEGAAQIAIADNGLLTFIRGREQVPKYPIVWVNRDGSQATLLAEPGSYANPRLSPDGRSLSLSVFRDGNWDVWVHDLERNVSSRITFDPAIDTEQVWSADGKWLMFSSDRGGINNNLFRKPADGSRQEEQLTKATTDLWATSWSPDGRTILAMLVGRQLDVVAVSLDREGAVDTLLAGPYSETDPVFSPDGQWVAYTSAESGRPEVYIRAFAPGSGRWQASNGGGAFPRWAGNGRELFYRTATGIAAVSIEAAGGGVRTGRPRLLFTGDFRGGLEGITLLGHTFADYDVSADGRRFVMFPTGEELARPPDTVTFVTSWFDELRRAFERPQP